MEKKKYDLCLKVVRILKDNDVLDKIMLVGSWCVPVYDRYFKGQSLLPALRTRDMEFLIPIPCHFKRNVDLPKLIEDLGFIADFKGAQGYMTLVHPDLILEFLVPARGKGSDKPRRVDQLSINAQPLRFMDALARNPTRMLLGDITVTVPHPADFALHKLLVAGRRKKRAKAEKDRNQAVAILQALINSDETQTLCAAYEAMPRTWQKTIKRELTSLGEEELVAIFHS